MMRYFYFSLLLFAASQHLVFSQLHSGKETVQFLDGGLHFPPLIANTIEPRVGFIFQADERDLRLDIGNSIDLIQFNEPFSANERLTFGADFFTWTALRRAENFHFPVDAVDYLFGLNLCYSRDLDDDSRFESRLRWSHISAHMVDGRYAKQTSQWLDGQLPRVYSREFFELIAAYRFQQWARPYAGFTYVYHIDPPDLGKMMYHAGLELTLPHDKSTHYHPYVAYDIRLLKVGEYTAAHSIQAGVKTGEWYGKGVNVFLAYYSGMSVHGEYHDKRVSYWGPGITIEF